MDPRTHPFADTEAAQTLKGAIRRHTLRERGGLRELAKRLEINQATVLSHMANGRMAIPLDRAPQLAMALGLDVRQFTKAVIKQRYPSVTAVLEHEAEEHSERLSLLQLATGAAGSEPITPDRLRIISEVVRDKRPEERWLAINEIAAVRMLRELRPSGLDHADIGLLRAALEPRSVNAAD